MTQVGLSLSVRPVPNLDWRFLHLRAPAAQPAAARAKDTWASECVVQLMGMNPDESFGNHKETTKTNMTSMTA